MSQKTIIAAVLGVCFGIVMEKSKVYVPEVIKDQMHFTNLLMLKVFLSALSVSMFVFGVLDLYKVKRCPKAYTFAGKLNLTLIGE